MTVMKGIVSMHAAVKSTLPQRVRKAIAGESVYIGAYGRAEVQLVPATAGMRPHRRPGLLKSKLMLPESFAAPLPENVLRSFEGEAGHCCLTPICCFWRWQEMHA